MRKLIIVSCLACGIAVLPVASAHAASGGGCQLQGTANFSPGLSNTAQPFTYSFSGDLSSCQSQPSGAPATGTVSAGRVETDPATGEQFQEPVPSGNGSCATSTTAGTAIVSWADGTTTEIPFTPGTREIAAKAPKK